jgi:hypothetical protein
MGGLSDLGAPEITPAAARVLNRAGFIFLASEIVVVVPLLIVHVAVWIWIVAAFVTLLVDMAIWRVTSDGTLCLRPGTNRVGSNGACDGRAPWRSPTRQR